MNKVKYQIKNVRVHKDKRGWLVEMVKRNELKEDIKQVYVATIKPGCVRGSHYHLKRKEWFFITEGIADIYLEDIKTKKRVRLKVSSKKPRLITIFPKIAHAVKNTCKKTVYLVSAQNHVYNRKNPDTNQYLIINKKI